MEGNGILGYILHQFSHKAIYLGKDFRPGVSRDPVNLGLVNQGFTVSLRIEFENANQYITS